MPGLGEIILCTWYNIWNVIFVQ